MSEQMSEHINVVDDATFEAEVLKAKLPVLVDFWADWCGPCKSFAPIVEEVAEERLGKVKIAKINIDENPDTPAKYNIRGIPTVILFKDGEEAATKVGALTKMELVEFLDENI